MGLRCFKRKPALCQVDRAKRFHVHCQFWSHCLEHCVDKRLKGFFLNQREGGGPEWAWEPGEAASFGPWDLTLSTAFSPSFQN